MTSATWPSPWVKATAGGRAWARRSGGSGREEARRRRRRRAAAESRGRATGGRVYARRERGGRASERARPGGERGQRGRGEEPGGSRQLARPYWPELGASPAMSRPLAAGGGTTPQPGAGRREGERDARSIDAFLDFVEPHMPEQAWREGGGGSARSTSRAGEKRERLDLVRDVCGREGQGEGAGEGGACEGCEGRAGEHRKVEGRGWEGREGERGRERWAKAAQERVVWGWGAHKVEG